MALSLVAGAHHVQKALAVARVQTVIQQPRASQGNSCAADGAYRRARREQLRRLADDRALLRTIPRVSARQQGTVGCGDGGGAEAGWRKRRGKNRPDSRSVKNIPYIVLSDVFSSLYMVCNGFTLRALETPQHDRLGIYVGERRSQGKLGFG